MQSYYSVQIGPKGGRANSQYFSHYSLGFGIKRFLYPRLRSLASCIVQLLIFMTPRALTLLGSCVFFSAGALVAAPKIDYTKRVTGNSAVATYEVPYVVPSDTAIKAVLDRIRDRVFEDSNFKVFDNATGLELKPSDTPVASATIDRRRGRMVAWDYTNGVVFASFSRISELTGDQSYFDHNVRFYDFIFTWMPWFQELEKRTGKPQEFHKMVNMGALDHCGAITFALVGTQMKHQDPRYAAWIKRVDQFISDGGQFRLSDGSLARQRPQPVSVWTDDFYMSIPFLAKMGVYTGDHKYWDDAVKQVVQLSGRLFDERVGLYAHGWSENAEGYSPRFYWGRANGWAAMAMTELLAILPADYPGREKVLHLYRSHVCALVELQDASGLWHNMLNKTDTYLETSASAMFVYAIARGVNEGWLSPLYTTSAIVGWNGLNTRVLPDGRVDGICEGTTYANDNNYYYRRGASANTTFFGSVLFAGAEVWRLVRNPELRITPAKENSVNSAIQVKGAGATVILDAPRGK